MVRLSDRVHPSVSPVATRGTHISILSHLSLSVPGELYVIDITAAGDNFGAVVQQIPDPYHQGSALVLGEPVADLWFQEGLANSIPLTKAYCKNDLWQHLARADGSIFKNQGDCIQYVNTGK